MIKIPENERVPVKEKVSFAIGSATDYSSTQMTTIDLWMPFFNLGIGMNAAVLGFILMIYRLWDAVTDPIAGNISDNARTRFGRRRPFMFVAGILLGCLFPVFWFLPDIIRLLGKDPHTVLFSFSLLNGPMDFTLLAAALTVFGMLFFAVYSMWSMPYYGMQLELTPNYDEKTRVSAAMSVVGKLTMLSGAVMLWLSSSVFADPDAGKAGIVKGMHAVAIPFGVLLACVAILPALFVNERYYTKEASSQQKESLWMAVKESCRCRPLWFLIGISFFQVFGWQVVNGLGYYVNLFKVADGDIGNATMIEVVKKASMLVFGIALIPFWTWLAEKLDKKIVVAIMLFGGIIGQVLAFFCFRPDMPYLQIIPPTFLAGVLSSTWLLVPSMKADVADWEELRTGKRREGSLNAFYSWFLKVSLTAVALTVGVIVQFVAGIDPALDVQPEAVVNRLFMAYLLAPGLLLSLPLIFLVFYPLNRQKMQDIRAQLEARRGKF